MALRQIRNKKTGEVRMVNDEELGDYGIVKKPKPPGLIGMEDTSDLYKTDFSLPQTIRSVPKEKSLLEQFYDYQVPSGGFTGQGLVSNLKADVGNLVTGVKVNSESSQSPV